MVVDFSASWCGPCRAMKPVLSQLAVEYQGRVSVVVVDCEETPENRALAGEAEIRCGVGLTCGSVRQRSNAGSGKTRGKDLGNAVFRMWKS